MKKMLALLVVLIGLYVAFWYYNGMKFKEEVKTYLTGQNVTYDDLTISGFPYTYKVTALGAKEVTDNENFSFHLTFEHFYFYKKILSSTITVYGAPHLDFNVKSKKDDPEFPFSYTGFSGKIIVKGLPSVAALDTLFSDLGQAITNPNSSQFIRKIILQDFIIYQEKNEPLITWEKLFFSLSRSSAVGGVYRSEMDVDLKNFEGDEKLWEMAISPLKQTSLAPVDESVLNWMGEIVKLYLTEKKNLRVHLGFTFPEGFSPTQLMTNPQEIFEKLLDAEAIFNFSSMGTTADTEVQYNSVIIDEYTKQISYDVHYQGHYSKHYWELADKALESAAKIKADTDEFKFLVTWAKTLQHFKPHWENVSFDYGFLTDVDRKTLAPKSAGLKQLRFQIDDMSISVGTVDETIDFSHLGILGDEKIPITIRQYSRLFGGLARFLVEWIKEAKASGLLLTQNIVQPKDDLPKNVTTLIKELSDEPESTSHDATITILVGEAGPKKVGTLPLIQAIKKLYQFYENSFNNAEPTPEPELKLEPKPGL